MIRLASAESAGRSDCFKGLAPNTGPWIAALMQQGLKVLRTLLASDLNDEVRALDVMGGCLLPDCQDRARAGIARMAIDGELLPFAVEWL